MRQAGPLDLALLAEHLADSSPGKHAERVFTYEGAPIGQPSTKAWYGALKRVGIADFKWHDLRHTWAPSHVQAGTPLFALQQHAGWESERMVRRYAHLAADHLAVYAGNVESTAQIRHSRVNIRCSRAESESSLLNLLRNHAG